MCLLLKLLQIQLEKEILVEYLLADEFKSVCTTLQEPVCTDHIYACDRYLRVLAAMYIRMTFWAVDMSELLEPLLKDYQKLQL